MASLRKIPGCKYWIACISVGIRRRTQRSTRETNRQKAQKIADQYEEVARKQMTAQQVQRVVTSLYKEITGTELPNGDVKAYFEGWLKRKNPEVSHSTRAFYENKTKLFLDFLGAKSALPISNISSGEIHSFRDHEGARVGSKTVNHNLKFLRMVFSSARREGYIVDNPCELVKSVKYVDKAPIRAFTLAELKSVLNCADDEWKSMIYFGLYTGQRLKDLALLTWQNVDVVNSELHLRTSKTGRQQIIPLAGPLRRLIENLPATDDPKQPIHPRAFAIVTKQKKTGSLSRMFYELMAHAGLVEKRNHHQIKERDDARRSRSEISFHALRHTATSLMKNAGVSSAIVQEFIGHDSPAISANYTHIETSALKKAAESLPDVLM